MSLQDTPQSQGETVRFGRASDVEHRQVIIWSVTCKVTTRFISKLYLSTLSLLSHYQQPLLHLRMGASVSRLPENITEQECKKLAGIRWENGLKEIYESAPKNEDGTINKALYLEHFQLDPFQVC